MKFDKNHRGVPLVVLASGLFAFWCIPVKGYTWDMAFWQTWTQELVEGGFGALRANYPPLYLEWLWVVAQAYKAYGLSPSTDTLFKTWVALPVVVAQMLVVGVVARTLAERGRQALRSPALWLTAFNPALLLAGPVWGQVDILPMAFIGLGLYLYQKDARHAVWLPALGLLALLTKFQAIVFLPVMGALALRHPERLALGLGPAVVLVGLVLLPFWNADVLIPSLERAYVDNLSLYPHATYNAANLWYLLGQNEAPDNLVIFTWEVPDDRWARLLTSKMLGMAVFGLVAAWIFLRTIAARPPAIYPSALGLAVVFFVFASGMHERYLVPAVVMASLAAAQQDRYWLPYLAITILTSVNVQLVQRVSGVRIWTLLSTAVVLLPVWLLLQEHLNHRWLQGVRSVVTEGARRLVDFSDRRSGFIYVLFLLLLLSQPWQELRARQAELLSAFPENYIMLSSLTPEHVEQDWGSLRVDNSVAGRSLQVAGRSYAYGLGTHARSVIRYRIPVGAVGFQVLVGIDDAAPNGRARFSVQVDGEPLWTSGTMVTGKAPEKVRLALGPRSRFLDLVVDPLGRNRDDHANWVNALFELEPQTGQLSGQSHKRPTSKTR